MLQRQRGSESSRFQSIASRHSPRDYRVDEESAPKHFFRRGEVKPMFSDVGTVLGFVPLKGHCNSKCSYNQKKIFFKIMASSLDTKMKTHQSVTDVTRSKKS
jgi:hypothetical protein